MARFGRMIGSRTAIFIAAAVPLFAFVVSRTLMKQVASAELPETIEAYRTDLKQPDFGMYFIDFSDALSRPARISSMNDAKLRFREFLGQRSDRMGATESISSLVANYSAVTRKRVSFGRRWLEVTNAVSYDDTKPRTRRDTLRIIEGILGTNGGFVVPLNFTNVVLLTGKDLEDLGHRRGFRD